MKKLILILVLPIIGFINVYAYDLYTVANDEENDTQLLSNLSYYNDNKLQNYNRVAVYNCSSNTTCNGNVTYASTTGGTTWLGTMASNGYDIVHDLNSIMVNKHLYSYSYTACFMTGQLNNFSNRIWLNTGLGSGRANQVDLLKYDYYSTTNLGWQEVNMYNNGYTNYCLTFYNLFINNAGNGLTIKTNFKSSSFSGKGINFIGYRLEDLGATNGLTSADVQNVINNSGLATATSINQVQAGINQVQQEISDVNDTLTEDHTYNQNASENIEGKDEIDDMTDAEENLMDSLDLSGASDINISINPNSSNFIWDIVNRLRNMSTAIITLFTSILGLGIVKMILNR